MLSNRPWKRSYLLWRWFQRSRAVLLGGLALWATLFALVMWLATNFELPESDEAIPGPTFAEVPEADNAYFAYQEAASRVVWVLPSGQPEFDLNGDGQRVSDEYLHLASVPLTRGRSTRGWRAPWNGWWRRMSLLSSAWFPRCQSLASPFHRRL